MARPIDFPDTSVMIVRHILSALVSEKSVSSGEKESLTRGFELAWFIHQDRSKAEEIAARAFARHETVVEGKTRYLDYSAPRRRTKVQLTRNQYYQYEVLRHSDELQEEELKRATPLDEDTMLVYFFSFIIVNLFRTNSFRATASIGRLLFRLSADQTRVLYQTLNPGDRDRSDDEYNREKMKLYTLLRKRFENAIIAEQLPRNEKSFKEQFSLGRLRELAEVCLEKFAPWRDKCLLTEQVNVLSKLEPDTAEAERDRIHVALHCLRKLTQMVFGQEKEPLIPQFIFASSGDDSGRSVGPRLSSPQLTESDYQKLLSKAIIQRRRRREALTHVLQCKVDGNFKTEMDLRRSKKSEPIIFTDEDNYLEVWAEDVLLATYYLPSVCDLDREFILKDSITLEGGQRVTFNCSLRDDDEWPQAGSVFVRYQETSFIRKLARQKNVYWRRIEQTDARLPGLAKAALISFLMVSLTPMHINLRRENHSLQNQPGSLERGREKKRLPKAVEMVVRRSASQLPKAQKPRSVSHAIKAPENLLSVIKPEDNLLRLQIPTRQKQEIRGVIISRDAEKLVLRTEFGADRIINVTSSTKVTGSKSDPYRGAKSYPLTSLLRGLEIEVEGHGSETGAVIADKINFSDYEYGVARSMVARVIPPETRGASPEGRNGAARNQLTVDEQNARRLSYQLEELADIVNTTQGGASAEKETGALASTEVARANIQATKDRISKIGNYEIHSIVVVNFKVNSAVLSPEAKTVLDEIALQAKNQKGYLIRMTGFASADSSESTNRALGGRRAEAVRRFLAENHDIPLHRMIIPFDIVEIKPVAENYTREGRHQNHRVEIEILVNKGLTAAPPVITNTKPKIKGPRQ